jgi:hypothetical protein
VSKVLVGEITLSTSVEKCVIIRSWQQTCQLLPFCNGLILFFRSQAMYRSL